MLDTIGIHLGITNVCVSYVTRTEDNKVKIEILKHEDLFVTPVVVSFEDGGEENFKIGHAALERQVEIPDRVIDQCPMILGVKYQ